MVEKIEGYTDAMFKLNLELEMKVRERTKTIEEKNEQLKREIEERTRAEEALKYANRMLEKLSTTDSLTGLYNRRVFEQSLKKYWKTALREKQPISMILCDIDHFKKINDTYGHQAGDRCLKEFAQILQVGQPLQKQDAFNELVRVLHFIHGFMILMLIELLQSPVLVHSGMEEVLVDCRQLISENPVEVFDDLVVALHR